MHLVSSLKKLFSASKSHFFVQKFIIVVSETGYSNPKHVSQTGYSNPKLVSEIGYTVQNLSVKQVTQSITSQSNRLKFL